MEKWLNWSKNIPAYFIIPKFLWKTIFVKCFF